MAGEPLAQATLERIIAAGQHLIANRRSLPPLRFCAGVALAGYFTTMVATICGWIEQA
jgi:hypothetical protein